MPKSPLNPYVGLRPYEREDKELFFGRDREANELLSLIVANRIVVLYAQSGAGKTSLLNAQVAPLLESEGFEVCPIARVQGPKIESITIEDIPNIYSFYTLLKWSGNDDQPVTLKDKTITQFLLAQPHAKDEFDYACPRVIIFDQFEELFTAFPARWQEREAFLNQINRALADDPLLRVVFSLREDYIAQLDPYAHLLPKNLRARFRLERMRAGAALEAIREPINSTNRHFAPGVAEQIVEDLRVVRVETTSGETNTISGEFVEPVQLQVVCQNLWDDLPDDVTTITTIHLQKFGNVDQALASFYERAIDGALSLARLKEAELRQWFEETLITTTSTRGTVYRGAETTGGLENAAINVLEDMHLIRGEIRAGARWYELTHDRLIEPIQHSNRQWHNTHQQARIKRIRRIAAIAFILVLISLCGYGLFFLSDSGNPIEAGEVAISATIAAENAAVVAATATIAAENAAVVAATATIAQATAIAGQSTAIAGQSTAIAARVEAIEAQSTAIEAIAVQATAAKGTSTAQYIADQLATSEWGTIQAIATATSIARATSDVQATQTAAELERLSQPVRPLQPGISIGSFDSATAGSIGAFVKDDAGNFYLLGPLSVLGKSGTEILQPSPIDGGQQENVVARTGIGSIAADGLGTTASTIIPQTQSAIMAIDLVGKAQLLPGIPFQTTIPNDDDPIVVTNVREPEPGMEVLVIGRTSRIKESSIISCPNDCSMQLNSGIVTSPFAVNDRLSPGDEGALVIDKEGNAIGIVTTVASIENYSLIAPLSDVLTSLDVSLAIVGDQLAKIPINGGRIWTIAMSPRQDLLAIGNASGTVQLLNLKDPNQPIREIGSHETDVYAVTFSPDGRFLASAGADSKINLWDLDNPTDQNQVLFYNPTFSHIGEIHDIAITPDNIWLVSAGADNSIRLWNLIDKNIEPIILTDHKNLVHDLDISSDGHYMASASFDGTVRLWDLTVDQPEIVSTFHHNDYVFAVAFSPNNSQLATSSGLGDIVLWSLLPNDLKSHAYKPDIVLNFPDDQDKRVSRSLDFSPDGQYLVASTDGSRIYQWDLLKPNISPHIFRGHEQRVPTMVYDPIRHQIISGSSDGTIRIWLTR